MDFTLTQTNSTSVTTGAFGAMFNSTLGEKRIRNEHRTMTGDDYFFDWGGYREFKLRVDWMPTSFRNMVNSWWGANEILTLSIGAVYSNTTCRIMNRDKPISEMRQNFGAGAEDYYWQGIIEITTMETP